jgi:hypothetical protein
MEPLPHAFVVPQAELADGRYLQVGQFDHLHCIVGGLPEAMLKKHLQCTACVMRCQHRLGTAPAGPLAEQRALCPAAPAQQQQYNSPPSGTRN